MRKPASPFQGKRRLQIASNGVQITEISEAAFFSPDGETPDGAGFWLRWHAMCKVVRKDVFRFIQTNQTKPTTT